MTLYTTEAVVLRSGVLGEADRLLTLYSRDRGKLRASARGARRPRNRLMAASQPFIRAEYVLFEGSGIQSISQAEIKESFLRLREEFPRLAHASYAAELLERLVEEGQGGEESTRLFDLLVGYLRELASGEDALLLTRYYEVRLLDALGWRPVLDRCVNCGSAGPAAGFSAELGGIFCEACPGGSPDRLRLGPESLALFRKLLGGNWQQNRALRPSVAAHRELSAALRACLALRVDGEIKSGRFLPF